MIDDRDPPPGGDEEDFATLFEQSQGAPGERLRVGQKVRGKILQIGSDWTFLDIGAKGEALLATAEICDEEGRATALVGEEIEARVVRLRDDGIVVSRVLQRGPESREMLAEARELGLPVEGLVQGVVKGGLEVDVAGVRAFCPASQVDLRYVEDLAAYVGERLTFRVSEYREGGRNVILSRRALLEEEQAKLAAETRKKIAVGAVLGGTVASLREFGAFVDLGGVDALLPVSEISRARVERPADVLRVGQPLEVKIVRLEGDRITVSRKALEPDPWDQALESFAEGTKHRGVVVRLQPFGAFVELCPGVEGLLHVSNLGDPRIKDPRQLFAEGQELEVTVITVDPAKRRIGLALSEVAAAGPVEIAKGRMLTGKVERVESYGVLVRLPGPPVGGRPPRGLIPVEEIGPSRGDLRREFPPGADVKVIVLEPDAQGRIRLSRRAALEADERGEAAEYLRDHGEKAGFGTLGDLLARERPPKKRK
jgi:small subunit ribosomal protein S1